MKFSAERAGPPEAEEGTDRLPPRQVWDISGVCRLSWHEMAWRQRIFAPEPMVFSGASHAPPSRRARRMEAQGHELSVGATPATSQPCAGFGTPGLSCDLWHLSQDTSKVAVLSVGPRRERKLHSRKEAADGCCLRALKRCARGH